MDSKDYKMIRFFRQLEKLIDAGEVKNIGNNYDWQRAKKYIKRN